MTKKNFHFGRILISLAFLTLSLSLQAANWPHETSDLTVDDTVLFGKLDNGFRYAIKKNSEPPSIVSVRLRINAGSLMEDEDQRGLAHFLEHMAFNGTKHYSSGEMIEYFQRLGMAFGADTNAHTSFDETVYILELPKSDPKMLEDGFLVMRDYADGVLLNQEEIDKERGIILAEKAERDIVKYRTTESYFNFISQGTRIAERLPLGLTEVIQSADQPRFREFYNKWYRPDRMILVVVGDLDVYKTEQMIKNAFASMPIQDPLENPDFGKVPAHPIQAKSVIQKEASELNVVLAHIENYEDKPDSKQVQKQKLLELLANSALNRRLDKLSKEPNAPIISATAGYHDITKLLQLSFIDIDTQPNNWKESLRLGENELRRALEFGFTESELKIVASNILNVLETANKRSSTRLSPQLADEILAALGDDEVYTSPQYDLQLAKEFFADIDEKEVWQAFRNLWNGGNIKIFISGNLDHELSEEEILAEYNQSKMIPVEIPEEEVVQQFAYCKPLAPSASIVSEKFIEDLGIRQYRLSNNIRLNLKKTDFEKDKIIVKVRFGGGLLDSIGKKPGLSFVTENVFIDGGLKAHSFEDIQKIFAGKNVGVKLDVTDDAFILSGSTSNEDLKDQLSLICAYLTSPGYREESLRQAHKMFDKFYIELAQTPEGIVRNEVERLLTSNDSRFGFPTKEQALNVSLKDIQNWMDEPLKESYMEVTLIGDFNDPIQTLDLVKKSLGALPKRAPEKPTYSKERKVVFPHTNKLHTYPVDSSIPRGLALIYWPTTDGWNYAEKLKLDILADVFDDRMRKEIREAEGLAYSTSSASNMSLDYKKYGRFLAVAFINPSNADDVLEKMQDIAEDLALIEITDEEVERALNPHIKNADLEFRSNAFWLTYIGFSQEQPRVLQRLREKKAILEKLTRADIQEVAYKYLKPEKGIPVKVLPNKSEEV